MAVYIRYNGRLIARLKVSGEKANSKKESGTGGPAQKDRRKKESAQEGRRKKTERKKRVAQMPLSKHTMIIKRNPIGCVRKAAPLRR